MKKSSMAKTVFLAAIIWCLGAVCPAANDNMPASPVKLIFIHHSTGGHWLADPNADGPYGRLGLELMNNNYAVSATNYGWGWNSIGDRTDIVDWPEWFTGPDSDTITTELYNENGQNLGDFGDWSRPSAGVEGENTIILFKSCFPNSDLFGNPEDPPGAIPDDQFTVRNAKAVYNSLLTYFRTRQDKLFIVVTAPPQLKMHYPRDYQTAAQRAANARAFNNWLVNDWLDGYAYDNVAVFDYFNVLTAPDNHHRYHDGDVEHVTVDDNNFAIYTAGAHDSHPSTEGHLKATEEFVPLLNYYYNKWQGNTGPLEPRWVPISGSVTFNGVPLCTMVLANGQHMFTCAPNAVGDYALVAPTDGRGRITLYAFCEGLAPFKQVLTPTQAERFDIRMVAASADTPQMSMTCRVETAARPGYVTLSGAASYNGAPLCMMVLANGRHGFTCAPNPVGDYVLEAPLDPLGRITLYGFCEGLAPFKQIITP